MGPINLPDLTMLFWFALFGMVCAGIVLLGAVGWLGYHLVLAVSLYLGVAP